MNTYIHPFTHLINTDGTIPSAKIMQTRYLSDMQGFYVDVEAEAALAQSNPLIYEVYYAYNPSDIEGELGICTTIIKPGKVGKEFFMTKGHFHGKIDRAELYFGLSGEGILVLETPDGETNAQVMTAGIAAYVPPYWAHRTVNTGSAPFVFLACFPADAGYDYATIAERGFGIVVVDENGQPEIVPNPRR